VVDIAALADPRHRDHATATLLAKTAGGPVHLTAAALAVDVGTARSDPVATRGEDLGAAPVEHGAAALVDERTGRVIGPADHHLVLQLRTRPPRRRARLVSMARSDILWLTGQAALLVMAFVVVPATDGVAGRLMIPGTRPAAYLIAAMGAIVGVASVIRLGRQLVPQPTPVRGGHLIDSGIYGVVRHPIYVAVLLLIAGAVVRSLSLAGLLLLAVAFVFFDRKSAYEEMLLAATYPGYEDYRARVRWKLVPGVH